MLAFRDGIQAANKEIKRIVAITNKKSVKIIFTG
jgi:hypothetical protein